MKLDIPAAFNTNSRRLIRIWRSWGLVGARKKKIPSQGHAGIINKNLFKRVSTIALIILRRSGAPPTSPNPFSNFFRLSYFYIFSSHQQPPSPPLVSSFSNPPAPRTSRFELSVASQYEKPQGYPISLIRHRCGARLTQNSAKIMIFWFCTATLFS